MRRGDMEQFDLEQWEVENERAWQHFIALGVALAALLAGSFLIGLFFGWLIWGI